MHLRIMDVRHGSILVCGHRKQALEQAIFYLDPYHDDHVTSGDSEIVNRLEDGIILHSNITTKNNNNNSNNSISSSTSSYYQPNKRKYQLKDQLKIGIYEL